MNKTKATILSAAITGLMFGATSCSGEGDADTSGGKSPTTSKPADAGKGQPTDPAAAKHVCKGKNDCKGQGADGKNDCKGKGTCATVAHHECAGKNDCKGQGGCGANPGKNDCKGKGGCAVPLKH